MLALLVLVCPPLAVLLTAPASQAVKNVGLTLLLYVPGVLHAGAAVERYRAQRRYSALMQLLDARTPPAPATAATPPAAAPKPRRRKTAGVRAA